MLLTLKTPALFAHRGASSRAPENTLAALKLAKEQGASWVEFDVQLTKDHHVIVMHDDQLERTTNGRGLVMNHTLAQLKNLDAGGWFAEQHQGEKIPTLQECLNCAKEIGLNVNLELKAFGRNVASLAKAVHTILQQPEYQSLTVLVSSFNFFCLRGMYQLNKQIPLAYNVKYWPFSCWRFVQWIVPTLYSIHLHTDCVNSKRVQLLHAHNLKVLVYTVDDCQTALKFCAEGVDGLFTNDICKLKICLKNNE